MQSLAIAEILYSNTARSSLFSYLSHPENDVRATFWYADFNGRYIRLAEKYPDGAAIVAKYKNHLRQVVAGNNKLIKQTKFPTEEMGLIIVDRNPNYIRKIPQTLKMRLLAINKKPDVICLLPKPKSVEILTAIRKNGKLIKVFPEKEKYYFEAVRQDPEALQYIKNPTNELIWNAISKLPRAIVHVKFPTLEMSQYAMKQGVFVGAIANQTEEFFYIAMKHDKTNFRHFPARCLNLQMKQFVIDFYPEFILELPNPPLDKVLERIKKGDLLPNNKNIYPEEVYYEYISKNPNRLTECYIRSERIIRIALKHNLSQFQQLYQTQELCNIVFKYFLELFGHFHSNFQSVEMCKIILKSYCESMLLIRKPSEEIIDYAMKCWPEKKERIRKYSERDNYGRPVYDSNCKKIDYPFFMPNFTVIRGGSGSLLYSC